jgi:type IV pilus assembly protein PilN
MKLTLNLADRSYINRRALYLLYLGAFAVLALYTIFQGGLAMRLHQHGKQLGTQLVQLEKSRAGERPAVENSPAAQQSLRQEVSLANDILAKDSFRWTTLLDRLEEVTQDGITIRSLQPDYRQGSLRLVAAARELPQLSIFLDRLLASGYFTDVYLLEQSAIKIKDQAGLERPAINFSLNLKGAFHAP